MGNQLVWSKRYDIGIDMIDKEHRKLFRILNKLLILGPKRRRASGFARRQSNILRTMPSSILRTKSNI